MDHKSLHFALVAAEQAESDAIALRTSAYAARRDERRKGICETLLGLGNQATIVEIAAAMGANYKVAWALVREMTALGQIEEIEPTEKRNGGENNGRPAPTYRVPNV